MDRNDHKAIVSVDREEHEAKVVTCHWGFDIRYQRAKEEKRSPASELNEGEG